MSAEKALAERVILITGASRGIGRAVAIASAEAGRSNIRRNLRRYRCCRWRYASHRHARFKRRAP